MGWSSTNMLMIDWVFTAWESKITQLYIALIIYKDISEFDAEVETYLLAMNNFLFFEVEHDLYQLTQDKSHFWLCEDATTIHDVF